MGIVGGSLQRKARKIAHSLETCILICVRTRIATACIYTAGKMPFVIGQLVSTVNFGLHNLVIFL